MGSFSISRVRAGVNQRRSPAVSGNPAPSAVWG